MLRRVVSFMLGLTIMWGILGTQSVWPHDASRPDLNQWFEGLHSGKGPCCSDADGALVQDADWDTVKGLDGKSHYRVRIEGAWITIPDDAVINEANRFGKTVVWGYPTRGWGGFQKDSYVIRCFMPGSMT